MKKFVFILLIFILLYTRLVGIDWGLPYPMHPDERNMSIAVQQLSCQLADFNYQSLKSCFNPRFFAYGQFPLYLAYIFIQLWHVVVGRFGDSIQFTEATLALRLTSTLASIINALVLVKIVRLFGHKSWYITPLTLTLFTFAPYSIQFSHFGTTESLLMLLYSIIIYLSLKFALSQLTVKKNILFLAFVSGLAIGTKVSSVIFCVLPLSTLLYTQITNNELSMSHRFLRFLKGVTGYLVLTTIFAILSSPHNIINWQEFLGSMRYESSVATGTYMAFYTRQFEHTIPVLFQLHKIFPYALGWPLYILSLLGFLFLSWKDKSINILRFAFLLYFLPTAFFYAKWTRFMAPIFPIVIVFAVLSYDSMIRIIESIIEIRYKIPRPVGSFIAVLILFIAVLPGFAYLSVYQKPDVRFTASEWIYKNISDGSYILSETANVVDIPVTPSTLDRKLIPIQDRQYRVISFDFYNLDTDPTLQAALQERLSKADYIFIPSRRLFSNNLEQYPKLARYYSKLFSGDFGFYKVAEFTSFPRIELLGKTLLEFPDEDAEETWTVFDHPVIRVYRRKH